MRPVFLRPSGAPGWMRCRAKPYRESGLTDTPGSAVLEGQAAHALRELCLTGRGHAHDYIGQIIEGVAITPEIVEYVQRAVDVLQAMEGELLVEHTLDIGSITGEQGATGTSDAIILNPEKGVLVIDDYKNGALRVDAKNNAQLVIYGAAALRQFDLLGEIHTIILRISQPRINHDDEWIISADELRYIAGEIRIVAEEILAAPDQMPATPGAMQCHFCKAKAHCPELQDYVAQTVLAEFTDITTSIDNSQVKPVQRMDHKALAATYAAAALIRRWCDAVEERTLKELIAGNTVEGFKLVAGRRGARTWRDEDEVALLLKSMRLADGDIYTKKIITPTAADKIFKDNPRKLARLQGFITQADAKPVIAPETDKRERITPPTAVEQFETITYEENT
jgi:hypothetical protein